MALAPCLIALFLASAPPPPPDVVTVDPALLVNRLIEWPGAQALRGKRVTAEAVPGPGGGEYGVVTFHVVDPALTPELRYSVTLDVDRTTGRPRDNAAQRETVIGRVQTARTTHREAKASAPFTGWAAHATPRLAKLSQVGDDACVQFVGGTTRTPLLTLEFCSRGGVTRYEVDAWLAGDAVLNDLKTVAGAGPVERVSLTRRPGGFWVATVVRGGFEAFWERADGGAWKVLAQ